jgi:hypothetical protein
VVKNAQGMKLQKLLFYHNEQRNCAKGISENRLNCDISPIRR